MAKGPRKGTVNNPQGKNQYTMGGAAKTALMGVKNRASAAIRRATTPIDSTQVLGTEVTEIRTVNGKPRRVSYKTKPGKVEYSPKTAAMLKSTARQSALGKQQMASAERMAKGAISAKANRVKKSVSKLVGMFGATPKKKKK